MLNWKIIVAVVFCSFISGLGSGYIIRLRKGTIAENAKVIDIQVKLFSNDPTDWKSAQKEAKQLLHKISSIYRYRPELKNIIDLADQRIAYEHKIYMQAADNALKRQDYNYAMQYYQTAASIKQSKDVEKGIAKVKKKAFNKIVANAMTSARCGDYDSAKKTLRTASQYISTKKELTPYFKKIAAMKYTAKARLLCKNGNIDEALSHYKQAFALTLSKPLRKEYDELRKREYDSHLYRANIYYHREKFDNAMAELKKAKKYTNNSMEIRTKIKKIQQSKSDFLKEKNRQRKYYKLLSAIRKIRRNKIEDDYEKAIDLADKAQNIAKSDAEKKECDDYMAAFWQLISQRKPAIAFIGVATSKLSREKWTDVAISSFRKILLQRYRVRSDAKSRGIFKELIAKYGEDTDSSGKIKELCRLTNSSYAIFLTIFRLKNGQFKYQSILYDGDTGATKGIGEIDMVDKDGYPQIVRELAKLIFMTDKQREKRYKELNDYDLWLNKTKLCYKAVKYNKAMIAARWALRIRNNIELKNILTLIKCNMQFPPNKRKLVYDKTCGRQAFKVRCDNGTKYGFIDDNNQIVILPKYDAVLAFSDGLAGICINGLWGYIDVNGKTIVDCKFKDVGIHKEGMAPVNLFGQWGFIDKDGKMVINPKYDDAHGFSDGLAAVKKNGKWGFINGIGGLVVSYKYDSVTPFSNGTAQVVKGAITLSINKKGGVIEVVKY